MRAAVTTGAFAAAGIAAGAFYTGQVGLFVACAVTAALCWIGADFCDWAQHHPDVNRHPHRGFDPPDDFHACSGRPSASCLAPRKGPGR